MKGSAELEQKGERFLTYLIQKLVAKTLDEFAFKLDSKPRMESSLINALSK